MSARGARRARQALTASFLLLIYLGLALVVTYPLARNFTTHHVGDATGDAKVYLWNYWWTKRAVTELGVSPLSTSEIFYPIGIGLSFHTLALLQGLEFVPLSAIVGNVAAANGIVLFTFVGSALAAYALARAAGARSEGAFLAGIAFGYCPYRLARLAGHYDLLGTEWLPLYAIVLYKLLETKPSSIGRSLSLVAGSGIAIAACAYTSLTYLVFLLLFTAFALVAHVRRFGRVAPRLVATGAVAGVLLLPLLHQAYLDRSQWTYPPYPGADRYVADLTGYLVPSPSQTLLGPALGRAFDRNVTETTVFAGVFVVAGGLAGLLLRRRIEGVGFWLAGAATFFVLSLGSSLHVLGHDTGVPLPFLLLTKLPLLDNLRAPSRLAIVTELCLAIVLSLVWSRLVGSGRFRALATGVGATVLVAELLAVPAPLFPASVSPVYGKLASEPNEETVVEIPGIEQAPVETMYHQTVHGKPIFVGTAARVPREKSEYYLGLPLVRPLIDLRKGKLALDETLVATERASAPKVARFLDLGYFVIDKTYEKRGVVAFLEAVLPVERWYDDGALVVLKVRREALPPDPWTIDPSSPESRQYFESGWLRPERDLDFGFRWANRERSTLVLRRPSPSARSLVLEVAPLDGSSQTLEGRFENGPRLDPIRLASGWQEVTLPLPPEASKRGIDRLWLRWSSLREASPEDPRKLAARIRSVRFE